MSKTAVGRQSELPLNEAKVVKHGNKDVAVFRTEEGIFAVENDCPHAYAPLSGGSVEKCVVECPLHGWTFNLKDGSPVQAPPAATIRCFGVVVEGDEVFITDPS